MVWNMPVLKPLFDRVGLELGKAARMANRNKNRRKFWIVSF